VLRYWADLPQYSIAAMQAAAGDGRLEALAMRTGILCRGGIEMGLNRALGPLLNEGYRDLGPFAGNLSLAYAHRHVPESFFRIEDSFDWEPDGQASDAVAYGFAAAIRDITEVCASETRPRWSLGRCDILREGSDEAFIELLRSSRSQAVEGEPDVWWGGFDSVLRLRSRPFNLG
jgi:hypothetical protein